MVEIQSCLDFQFTSLASYLVLALPINHLEIVVFQRFWGISLLILSLIQEKFQETQTLLACADSSTDSVRSLHFFLNIFLHFWALFRYLFSFFGTLCHFSGTFCFKKMFSQLTDFGRIFWYIPGVSF